MSKEAALRAMREARYAERAKGSSAPTRVAVRPAVAPATRPAAAATVAVETAETDELCGHKSMNGRTCTRERGHAAKSHRYG